jgi:alkylation response protein AidB-like acyl-CoA dehydrogenase
VNFELTDEQAMLRDSVRRWTDANYAFAQYQQIARSDGLDQGLWRDMASLGWLGISLPEEVGGLAQPLLETCIVAEELGRALVLEPFVPVAVFAGHLIDRAAVGEQRASWLGALIAGETIVAVAHGEDEARGDPHCVKTRATRAGDAWRLSGAKSLVFAADSARFCLVSARVEGDTSSSSGVSLFAVEPGAPGLVRRDYRTVDGRRASDLTLNDVVVSRDQMLGPPAGAMPAIEAALERAMIVLCAEAVGLMDQVLWLTRDYLRERRQFGVPIGSFQALQHRMADMYIRVQIARAALWRALVFLDDQDATQRRRAIATAKLQVGNAARFVCGQAIQLHGGLAITEQFRIGHYFRRMTVFDATFGTAHSHLVRIARELSPKPTRSETLARGSTTSGP